MYLIALSFKGTIGKEDTPPCNVVDVEPRFIIMESMVEGVNECYLKCTDSEKICEMCVDKVLEDNFMPSLCTNCLVKLVVHLAQNCDVECLKNLYDPDKCTKCWRNSGSLIYKCFKQIPA